MSKRQTILNRLRDVIFPTITTGAGYNNTVKASSVKRGVREMDAMADSEFPVIYIARTTEERENLTGNQFLARMDVLIVGYVKNSTGGEGMQEDLDRLIEDVTKVIEADRTLGVSGVSHTEIKRVVTDDGDLQQLAGMGMVIEIQYASEGIDP